MTQSDAHLTRAKAELDRVSGCFCLAKWFQVTVHLHNGTTHSCHHPRAHKIPLDELKENPSALHNTSVKLRERKSMLEGERPAGCDYCWRIEDSPGENISDRIYKSSYTWSFPFREEVAKNPLDAKFVPRNVEVNIGATCNMKCSYCSPEISTRWLSEIKQFGHYPTTSSFGILVPDRLPILEDQPNPYLDAWWKWWPDLYPNLHTFRITGGEPLLNKGFFRILEWIENHPKPDLILGVNTNLCAPQEQWDKFLSHLNTITENELMKNVTVYTSAEAWGEKAEYIRYGMNFQMWRDRLWHLLETLPQVQVNIMATYNALSVTSFDLLLKEVLQIKRATRLRHVRRPTPLLLDISFLRFPEHQTVKILTADFGKYLDSQILFMRQNPEIKVASERTAEAGFLPAEIQKMERIRNWFLASTDEADGPSRLQINRKDFYKFFAEHDRRRQTSFLTTFPEMREFWNFCVQL